MAKTRLFLTFFALTLPLLSFAERSRMPSRQSPSRPTRAMTAPAPPPRAPANAGSVSFAPAAPSPAGRPLASARLKDESAPLFRYRLTTGLGALILQNHTALQFGSRFGYAPGRNPFYVGGEFLFAIYSPGSLLGVLGGAWYELRVFGAPRLNVLFGLMGGMSLTNSSPLINLPSTALTGFFEASVSQQLDDLVSVHGQVRPGIVGGYFAILMSLGVSFRFL